MAEFSDLPYDILFDIMSLLGVPEFVALTLTSKKLMNDFWDDRNFWLKYTRQRLRDEFAAPYSVPLELSSTSELRDHATRSFRFHHHLRHQRLPELSSHTVKMDRDSPSFAAHEEYVLLPGGRWFLSTDETGPFLRLFLWDVNSFIPSSIRAPYGGPTSEITTSFESLTGDDDDQWLWITPRYVNENTVNILFTAAEHLELCSQMFALRWYTPEGPPIFETCSHTFIIEHFYPGKDMRPPKLEGDFACFYNTFQIQIWNWRENTWGYVEPRHHGLGDQKYELWLQPPYIYILPSKPSSLLVVKMPELIPTHLGTLPANDPAIEFSLHYWPEFDAIWHLLQIHSWRPIAHRIPLTGFISLGTNGDKVFTVIETPVSDPPVAPIAYHEGMLFNDDAQAYRAHQLQIPVAFPEFDRVVLATVNIRRERKLVITTLAPSSTDACRALSLSWSINHSEILNVVPTSWLEPGFDTFSGRWLVRSMTVPSLKKPGHRLFTTIATFV